MNERVSQIVGQVSSVWNGMPPKRRLLITGAVGAVFLIMVLLSFSATKNQRHEVLFSNLAASDAAEVLRELDERGISYSLQQHLDGRATILVPPAVVHRTRIELVATGIPRQGSVGFEIFDESQLGMTDDVRRINLRRALNGELERTIRAMDVVQDARVQVALPENKLFVSQRIDPSAAVMITLRPGTRLSADQVAAIQRLVGATIEGLAPENVFVVDNRGNPLSDQLAQLSAANGGNSVEQRLLLEQAVSNEYSRQVRNMLEGPFGPGAVEVMVNVELNFERAEEIIMAFEAPNGRTGIIRSEQRLEERFEGTGPVPEGAGVPGIESNVPGYVGIVSSGDSEYNRTEEIINYEINQIETRREIPPGAVKRLSVAVLIDGNLSQTQKDSVSNTLMTALGLNPSRGDQVYVESFPFVRQPAVTQLPSTETVYWYESPALILIAIAIAVLVILLYWLRQRAVRSKLQHVDLFIDDEMDPLDDQGELTDEEKRQRLLRDQILTAAKENPSDVARLLKTWLVEE